MREMTILMLNSFDSAETCELIGSYILQQLSQLFKHHSVGLYRDDGLAILKELSDPETEKVKKKVIKVFKDCELKITIKPNLHIVNLFDITLDLRNNTYEQYRKQDNHPVYIIHQPINSNYPKTILRELPKSISKRLSDLSSNKEIFQKATPIYFEALKKSGFNEPLVFIPKTNTSDNISKKQRKRKIIWFNPPFSLRIKTNIGRTFLKLLKQHFPKSNRLHKIFNKNTVKVSYSCMSNLSSIISSHNKRLLRPRITEYDCNCRTRENCPLQNQCLTPNLIYRADVENNANKGTKIYFGLAETSFKISIMLS